MHFGNWGELYSEGLGIRITRCNGIDAGCKSEEEIDDFLNDLWMFAFHNDMKYEANKFDEEPIKGFVSERFIKLSPGQKDVINIMTIQLNEVESEESLSGLGFSGQ